MDYKFKYLKHDNPPVVLADNWDGPYFRPFFVEEYVHREWWPEHSLSLNVVVPEGCWIYTLSGHGIYRCGNQRQILGPGQVFAYRSPDRGKICLDRAGLPWRVLNIHVTGEPGLALFDFIVGQFGMFHRLPTDCEAVKIARRMIRVVVKAPKQSPHFWSRLTFSFLDAWWECAQKSCGTIPSILRKEPHPSRLIGLGAKNVKALAEQLGYSRSHLSRKLKWQWDEPPGHVLRTVRMREAAKLLRTTHLKIGNVATTVGFSTASAFTRAFKQAHGVGPRAYRVKHGGGLARKRSARA